MTLLRTLSLGGLALAAMVTTSSAQSVSESLDLAAMQKIRDEGLTRSKIDDLAQIGRAHV